MVTGVNNILHSQNKSRVKKASGSASSGAGKNSRKTANRIGSFIELLQNNVDSNSGKRKKPSENEMTAIGELLQSINNKNYTITSTQKSLEESNSLHKSVLNKATDKAEKSHIEAVEKFLHSHSAKNVSGDGSGKTGTEMNNNIKKIPLPGNADKSEINIQIKKEHIGENNNPLDNNINVEGKKSNLDGGTNSKKEDNQPFKNDTTKGTGENILTELSGQKTNQPKTVKVSSLANYGTYGPMKMEEFGRTILNVVKNVPDNTVYSAKLVLKPESIGTLFVEIHMGNDIARINIKADKEDSAKAIEKQLPLLKEKLNQHGVTVENIEVSYSPTDNDRPFGNNGEENTQEEIETRRVYLSSFRKLRDEGIGTIADVKSGFQV